MTEQQWIALAGQLPFVGIVVWLMLKLHSLHREERKERDAEWRTWLAAQRTEYLAAITGMATDFRTFVAEQRAVFAERLQKHEDNTEAHLERVLGHIDTILARRGNAAPREPGSHS